MSYRISDEPQPGAMSSWVSGPVFALFALMFAGPWLAWPWAVLNSFALGSHRRRGDLAIVIIAVVVAYILTLTVLVLHAEGTLDDRTVRYAFVADTSLKLGVSYWLYMRQAQSHQLFVYYGGRTRNALLVVGAGWFLRQWIPVHLLTLPVL